MNHKQYSLGIGLLLTALAVTTQAEVRLPHFFTDNMMLQRDQPIRVWGWAEPGEAVTVTLASKSAASKANESGELAVALPAMSQGENLELSINGRNAIVLNNVILGDIWICSGQSNMETTLGSREGGKALDIPRIRCLKISTSRSANPETDISTSKTQTWQVCRPDTAGGFAAVGFYFAREIEKETGVPIGLLDDNLGGTLIEPWVAPAGQALVPELQGELLDKYVDWCSLYNAMINPLVRFPIKGALWYQGENNVLQSKRDNYCHKMKALVGGWRKGWNQGDFPFYFVQLPNYNGMNYYKSADDKVDMSADPKGGDSWAKLREEQTKALSIPNTGMAIILDTAPFKDASNIHPVNKYDVGMRLARWALNRDYGRKDLVVSGPLFKSMQIEGNNARLTFDYAGSGLMIGTKEGRASAVEDHTGKLRCFAIVGAD